MLEPWPCFLRAALAVSITVFLNSSTLSAKSSVPLAIVNEKTRVAQFGWVGISRAVGGSDSSSVAVLFMIISGLGTLALHYLNTKVLWPFPDYRS